MTNLSLTKEEAKDLKSGKPLKDPRGEIQYIRNDIVGLMSLLAKMDSKIHSLKDYKSWIKLRDKLRNCFVDEKDVLEMSIDEAAFLKDFLSNLTEREGKQTELSEFEIRTLVGILEQFEGK